MPSLYRCDFYSHFVYSLSFKLTEIEINTTSGAEAIMDDLCINITFNNKIYNHRNNDEEIDIYTDGSRSLRNETAEQMDEDKIYNNYRVGCAVHIPKLNKKLKFKLNSFSSSFTAEMVAINKAIERAIERELN